MKTIPRNKKYRVTKQRELVLSTLKNLYTHPTAKELHSIISKDFPDISMSTVYRNLQFLNDNNLIIKLKTKNKKTRYDGNTNNHIHLICTKCNKIIDIYEDIDIVSKAIKNNGFKINLNHLELPGLCKDCIL